jgi:hypothetical protein
MRVPYLRQSATRLAAIYVACTLIVVPATAFAAPISFQSAVLAKNPFTFFRQQETGISTGTAADSIDASNRDATYQGSPADSAAGAGAAPSDTAVTYSGAATGTASQYFGGTNLRSFGASLGASSYEFVFKVNQGFTNDRQSLFGVFNTGNTTAAEVTLNSVGNDAVSGSANIQATRLFIRGDDGDGVGVSFVNPTLYDGQYHHLVFTFDRASLAVTPGAAPQSFTGGFAAYVDGVPQTLSLYSVNAGATDSGLEPDTFTNFNFDPTFLARNVRTTLGGTAVGRQANITLDEAVLYTRVLSSAEVADNFGAIPEPASVTLLGVALLAFLQCGRRRGA